MKISFALLQYIWSFLSRVIFTVVSWRIMKVACQMLAFLIRCLLLGYH